MLLFLALSMAHGQTNYLMNATLTDVVDCGGFFMDSGGGSGAYGPNQSFTTTICPDGSTGTHIQLVFSGTEIAGGDELCFFDGQDVTAPLLGCASDFGGAAAFIIQATAVNSSGCITLTFNSDGADQAPGWSADINCIPSCQTILAVLDDSDPIVEPSDTGYIDICPGERVFFWGRGEYPQDGAVYNHSDQTSDFEWDFGDGVITYGPNVSHVFEEPGGYIVQLAITDQLGCKNTNFISQRVRVAPRPHFAAGDWPEDICVGDTVNLNAMIDSMDAVHSVSVLPASEGFQTAGIRSDSLALPDGTGSSYLTSITFSDFSPGQLLTNIDDLLGIWVNMEHSWMRDLQISLSCPNGQSAILHNHPGQTGGEVFLGIPYENDEGLLTPIPGTGYDYGWQSNPDYNQTWIEYANSTFVNTLPSGSYESYEPLTNFLGCPLNGDWTIEVTDLWGIDNGYIFSWSIDFAQDLYPAIETFTPSLLSWGWDDHPSVYFEDPDSLAGTPGNAGEVAYTFVVEDEFGCAWDTTVEIQVLPFTHPDCRSCGDLLNPAADTTICEGEMIAVDVQGLTGGDAEVTFESFEDYPIGAGNHPPATPYLSTININSISPATISDPAVDIVSVCFDLTTDFNADMQFFLVSPTGQMLMLSTNNGGGGDNYTQTCFTPTATTPITSGTSPFTGNFQPEGSWNVLNNEPINGAWSLQVSDAFGINALGNLNWWNITFRSTNDVLYDWDASANLSCDDCPDPTITPAADELFIVEAVDSYGCTAIDSIGVVVLNSFPAPAVNCSAEDGGEMVINWDDVAPGLDYEINVNGTGWVPANNGTLSHMLTGLVNGDDVNVEVRVISPGASCQVGIGTSFCQYLLCPLSSVLNPLGPYAVSCAGVCDMDIQISVSNGVLPFTFDVTNQTTGDMFTQMDGNLADLCPGEYEVIITDATMCMDTVAFVVNDQTPIDVVAVQDNSVSCSGGSDGCASVSASGGVGTYAYTWSDPNSSTGTPICNLPAGPYQVTATDLNGCEGVGSVVIDQPDQITLAPSSTDVSCTGDDDGTATVVAMGGTPDYTYQWSGGDTPNDQTTTGLLAGIYSVTVEDANGCQAFENVTVNEPPNGVTVTAMQTVMSCFGANQSEVTAMPTGGSGNYTYEWTPSGQTTQTAVDLPTGPYTVVVSDGSGCTAEATVDAVQLDPIDITLAGVPPTCHDGTDGGMAANIVVGGAGGYNFLWNTGDMDDFINGVQGGLVYTVTVTDMQGCTGTESRELDNPAEIEPTIELTNALCNGSADGIANVVSVANNQGTVSYQWDVAALSQTTAEADSLSAGSYAVVVSDAMGCSVQEVVEVGEPDPILTDFETVDNDCFGAAVGSIDVTVTGGIPGFNYTWSNGASSAKLTDLEADLYHVTITDQNGCKKLDSVMVEQPDSVLTNISVDDVSCFGMEDGRISLNPEGGTPPYLYSLDNQDFFGSSTLIALGAGPYTVYIRDAKDCIYERDVAIFQPPAISVEILANNLSEDELMIGEGEVVQLDGLVDNGIGNISYFWEASYCGTLSCADTSDCDVDMLCQMPVSTPDYTVDYYLTVQDENGCEAEDHLQIHVKKERVVEVPTGFTPDGNNNNDRLVVHGKSGTMVNVFQVFDRWGELLYEDFDVTINDTTRGWDGTFKTQDMPSGVYVWYVEVTYADGMTESFKGETTLIR